MQAPRGRGCFGNLKRKLFMPPEESHYDVDSIIRFTRLEFNPSHGKESGTVQISILGSGGVRQHFYIPPNLWASAVLCMTKFSERPNDWQAFMAHHGGETDMMGAAKQVASIKNILRHS